MNKRIRLAVIAAAVLGGFTLTDARAASAAHCVKGGWPGLPQFGQDDHEDGDLPPGESVCRNMTGSPSERAPGQNND